MVKDRSGEAARTTAGAALYDGGGVDPRVELVEDKTLYRAETWTKDSIRRAARGER